MAGRSVGTCRRDGVAGQDLGRSRRGDHGAEPADAFHVLHSAVGGGHIVAPGRMTDMPITANSVAHIRLTVTDIARSREFYESVFGWPVAVELPDEADDATRERMGFLFGGVIYDIGTALVGLRPVADDRFDSDRVGLDHLCLRVASKADLDAAAAHLDDLGIDHEPIKDIGQAYILEFRDPDHIALELASPK
jgi:glyoxylase I family protein